MNNNRFYSHPFIPFLLVFFFLISLLMFYGLLIVGFIYMDQSHQIEMIIICLAYFVLGIGYVPFGFLFLFIQYPVRRITIYDSSIEFKINFFKKVLLYLDVVLIKKDSYPYFQNRVNYIYSDCIYFSNTKFKDKERKDTCIPFSAIFWGSRKRSLKAFEAVMDLLKKNAQIVEPGLIEELIAKNEEYQKYGFLEKSKEE